MQLLCKTISIYKVFPVGTSSSCISYNLLANPILIFKSRKSVINKYGSVGCGDPLVRPAG